MKITNIHGSYNVEGAPSSESLLKSIIYQFESPSFSSHSSFNDKFILKGYDPNTINFSIDKIKDEQEPTEEEVENLERIIRKGDESIKWLLCQCKQTGKSGYSVIRKFGNPDTWPDELKNVMVMGQGKFGAAK